MTALDPLPEDYRLPTTGLEMLTGGAAKAQWRNWGFIDGWNWVVEGRPIWCNIRLDRDDREIYNRRRAVSLYRRLKEDGMAEPLLKDYAIAYTKCYDAGVRAADKKASNPVSHIGESLGTEPPSLNVVSEEEDPEKMTDNA